MPKPSFDGTQSDHTSEPGKEKSQILSRDLNNLQRDIRSDLDQKITDLTSLMRKFKALMVTDVRLLRAANEATSLDSVPILTKKVEDSNDQSEATSTNRNNSADAEVPLPNAKNTTLSLLQETARFETGLYHLNSQLYRFRLELDQELEYREEALHTHFRHQSDLAKVLQQITQKMQQEKNVKP
ncbi:hypothetical protein AB833_16505 [Chromatiales bacterium (ex Bugula neritina AB1)]|nr:hypothetical protein AB833_16505 [Chromatiales bacterium (ex Bugula neritina AB1)]